MINKSRQKMAIPRRKVGIPLPRPLRKPREQVSLDLNQNVNQEAEDETAQKKSTIENLNLVESESPLGGEDNYSKSDGLSNDEKSGHVKYKGSLRPDGTQRRDRMIKISTGYFSKKISFFHYLNQNLTQNCS